MSKGLAPRPETTGSETQTAAREAETSAAVADGTGPETQTAVREVDTAASVDGGTDRGPETVGSPHDTADRQFEQPAGGTGAAPAHRPRPWFRRRRSLLGAAVATVLLATLGTVSALSEDGARGDSARTPSGPSRTTEAGTRRAPSAGGASSSPAPGAGSASPSRGGTASPTPPSQDAPPVKDKASAPTAVPLALTVDSQVWQGGCGQNYVIDKAPAEVPPPPVPQDAAVWAATQSAVQGGESTVEISVQGKSSTAVVLNALRVRIVGRGTPVPGTAYSMGGGCGGGLTPRSFAVNLDVNRPIAHPVPGTQDGGPSTPAVQFPYRVSAQDPEVLLVTGTTETYDASWYLELDWSSQGRTGTVRIDDHGHPFRTSSIKGRPRLWYGTNDSGERAWVPTDS